SYKQPEYVFGNRKIQWFFYGWVVVFIKFQIATRISFVDFTVIERIILSAFFYCFSFVNKVFGRHKYFQSVIYQYYRQRKPIMLTRFTVCEKRIVVIILQVMIDKFLNKLIFCLLFSVLCIS